MTQARKQGISADAIKLGEFSRGLNPRIGNARYDACFLYASLEKAQNPEIFLERVRHVLKPEGTVMILCPSLDSRAARFFRGRWWEFRKENLFYFDVNTVQNLLVKAGFCDSVVIRDYQNASSVYDRGKVKGLHRNLFGKLLSGIIRVTPSRFRYLPGCLFDSRMIIMSRPAGAGKKTTLSVIVPVYNERATFSEMIEVLLVKEIPGVNIEIVIVESNSADGTREEVLKHKDNPKIKIVLEDKPRGKGFAVRNGLANITGDIVLIQDADLEYDINDYDALVDPILRYQQSFVIGSRHIRDKRAWKIREFNDAPVLSSLFNLGHLFFLTLFNIIYRQSLADPFSMFKVFRRDCLYGLSFECSRFDFDFEVVIKLLRKGYKPVEIPVNYRARSVREGKKVSMLRDPITWLRALIKYRFSPLYENMGKSQVYSTTATTYKSEGM